MGGFKPPYRFKESLIFKVMEMRIIGAGSFRLREGMS